VTAAKRTGRIPQMPTESEIPDWRWFVRPGDLVFDVGANMGAKAVLFLEQGARVVCVEPQPSCVAALRQRFRKERRVTIVAEGLAERSGALDLSICTEAHTISTFSDEWKTGRFANYKWDKTVRVKVTTLDALIAKHGRPSYCKVDVEGFEISVLKGLTRPAPLISFEFAREFIGNAKACVIYLSQIGYERFNFALGENPGFVCEGWLNAEGLFARIARIEDPEFWGDIYAHHTPDTEGGPPPPSCEKPPASFVERLTRLLSGRRPGSGVSLDK
jgi:FkbM family methyltransferase